MKSVPAIIAVIASLVVAPGARASDMFGSGFDWSGLYAGVNAGFASNDSQLDSAVRFEGSAYDELASRIAADQSTLMGGGLVGYNLQFGNIVLGTEADLNYLGFSDTRSKLRNYDVYAATQDTSFDASWFGTLRGRAGVAFGGFLLYGTGGLAAGDMQATATVRAVDLVTGEERKWKGSADSTNWGWAAGAGLEYGISNVSFGVEYLYVDLGDTGWDTASLRRITGLGGDTKADGAAEYRFGAARATAKLHF